MQDLHNSRGSSNDEEEEQAFFPISFECRKAHSFLDMHHIRHRNMERKFLSNHSFICAEDVDQVFLLKIRSFTSFRISESFFRFYLLWMEWRMKNSFVVLLKVSEWHRTNDKVRLESFDNGSLNATLHRDFVRHTRVPCDQRPINFLYLMVQ